MVLSDIKPGNKAIIKKIADTEIKRRLLDMGMTEGTIIECLYESMFKNPVAYLVRGVVIALRRVDAKEIMVEIIWK